MSRRLSVKKRYPNQDIRYSNLLVSLLINRVLKNGKKTLAKLLVYKAFDILQKKVEENPLTLFERAVKNISPKIQVKLKRVQKKKKALLIPTLISRYNSTNIALKWLISFSKKRSGKEFSIKLASEILDAANKTGGTFKKKEETHKAAEANKFSLRVKRKKKRKKKITTNLKKSTNFKK